MLSKVYGMLYIEILLQWWHCGVRTHTHTHAHSPVSRVLPSQKCHPIACHAFLQHSTEQPGAHAQTKQMIINLTACTRRTLMRLRARHARLSRYRSLSLALVCVVPVCDGVVLRSVSPCAPPHESEEICVIVIVRTPNTHARTSKFYP